MPNEVRITTTAPQQVDAWAKTVEQAVSKQTSFANQVRGEVSGALPHLTGRLAGSTRQHSVQGGFEIVVGEGLPYAHWIEFGGSRGRPVVADGRYVYPTASKSETAWGDAASKATEESIQQYPWH